ncbi:hypothetical protein ONZ45_g13934 [Pleurotus djamor]|nr:hypothetical protein ONZ45_g13934 [Pleurotus djamor]
MKLMKGEYSFTRSLKKADWNRFFRYSWRVKSLVLCADNLAPSSSSALIKYRPSGRLLLPNLENLLGPCNPDVFILFVSSSITKLCLHNPERARERSSRVKDLFNNIPQAIPNLEMLVIYASGSKSFQKLEDAFVHAVASLRHLKVVSVPATWISPRVTDALSTHPHLHSLHADNDYPSSRPPEDAPIFSNNFEPGRFQSLKSLSIIASFSQASDYFSSGRCVFGKLMKLKLDSGRLDPPESFSRFLQRLPSVCSRLTELDLHIASSSFLTFHDLKPLLPLQHLTTLALSHPLPFQVSGADLRTIVVTLTKLKSLTICPNTLPLPPTLHLSALSALSSADCSLEFIDIYFDLSRHSFPGKYYLTRPLGSLQFLYFGRGSSDDIPAVAEYLSRILPPSFKVHQQLGSFLEGHARSLFDHLRTRTSGLMATLDDPGKAPLGSRRSWQGDAT